LEKVRRGEYFRPVGRFPDRAEQETISFIHPSPTNNAEYPSGEPFCHRATFGA
jgi:hypothetical protein